MNQDILRYRQLSKDVQAVLLAKWDPLDVGDNPLLACEYDNYISDIIRILAWIDVSQDAIYEYLIYIERHFMGIHGRQDRRVAAAKELFKLAKSR